MVSTAHERYTVLQRHRNEAPLRLDPSATALVIIDMQEYFLDPASPFSRACEAIVPGVLSHFQERGRGVVEPSLRRLLDFFRGHGLRVVYTTVASELPDGSDLMPIFRERNAANRAAVGDAAIPPRADPWARIVRSLEPQPGELVVNKTTYDTFSSTGLDHRLRAGHLVSRGGRGRDQRLRGDDGSRCRRSRVPGGAAGRWMRRVLAGDPRSYHALVSRALRQGAEDGRGARSPGTVRRQEAERRLGRRTVRTLPLLEPPQKN